MTHSNLFRLLPLLLLVAPMAINAEDTSKKNPTLEEMTPAEFKEALKKSHAEIEARLGTAGSPVRKTRGYADEDDSLADKRAYLISASGQIDILDHKIEALESMGDKNWGYAQKDASKLRDIQYEARQQLVRIKSNNNPNAWKTEKQTLDSLLRQASQYN